MKTKFRGMKNFLPSKNCFPSAVIMIALAASLFAQTESASGNNKDNAVKETLINLEKRA